MSYDCDVFISHANEDKRGAALALRDLLQKKGFKVWFDLNEISVADSLRDRINEGIRRSRYYVVILSHRFLDKYWTRDELKAMLSREESGVKLVIPVLFEITNQELANAYPLIADRRSLNMEDGIEKVVDAIAQTIGQPANSVIPNIAVDFSHRQREWDFLDESIEHANQRINSIESGILESNFLDSNIRVLVVPPPFHSHFSKPEIDRIEDWVNAGGGLFLMGHYDERHHASNFSELAWRFDFDFLQDLLLPPRALTQGDQQLDKTARSTVSSRDPKDAVLLESDTQTIAHPILDGITKIAFLSASSIVSTSTANPELLLRCPKTTWIMRPVGRIQSDGSRPNIELWEPERQSAATVLAARTWGKGRVVVAGTWKLWTVDYGDNSQLLSNVLNWLSGT